MKKILMIVNYYTPYVSGLTEVVHFLAKEYVKRGHDVTVLCENHDSAHLASEEILEGVRVVRAPILCKISKGMISPKFISLACKLAKGSDVINVHAPMLEAGIICSLLKKKKPVLTYQCDIDLDSGLLNSIIKWGMDICNSWGMKNAHSVLVTTIDYGQHSRLASKYIDKLVEVHTPLKDYHRSKVERDPSIKLIGFCGRIVMEKGIDVLVRAFELLRAQREDIRLIIGGDYENVAGGSVYPELKNYIDANNISDITFLGKVPERDMEEFYSSLDVFVLPSVNPLEAFGMVQLEAMLCGTPVVASDLYGVRTIAPATGMGLVHRHGDAEDLARCINKILENPSVYIKPHDEISAKYSTKACADAYEKCFDAAIAAQK